MKKSRWMAAVSAVALMAAVITGCTGTTAETTAAATETAAETTAAETTAAEGEETEAEAATTEIAEISSDGTEVRVGSLKGPTTMGLVNLMHDAEEGSAEGSYTFTMATQADELLAGMVSGDLDIALVPANVASVLYNKTEGGVSVIDINTLGVLYCITGDESISSVGDLAGKTVLTTGQGSTPEYVLNYLLAANEVTDCTLEFKSEATEIAAVLQSDASQIAVLPQPFATVAMAQNEALRNAFSLTEAWDAVSDGSQLVTGVTIVRDAFLEEHENAVELFLQEHAESAEAAVSDLDGTAELIAGYGIIEKAPVAKKALPYCNIVCISGDEMETALSGYLNVLFEQNPTSVGGKLPEADFYYGVS